jgi:hypothetical protein
MINRARGGDYRCSPHHFDQRIDVHTVTVGHRASAGTSSGTSLSPTRSLSACMHKGDSHEDSQNRRPGTSRLL